MRPKPDCTWSREQLLSLQERFHVLAEQGNAFAHAFDMEITRMRYESPDLVTEVLIALMKMSIDTQIIVQEMFDSAKWKHEQTDT